MEFIWQIQITPIFSHQKISECLCSTSFGVKQTNTILLGFEIVDARDLYFPTVLYFPNAILYGLPFWLHSSYTILHITRMVMLQV